MLSRLRSTSYQVPRSSVFWFWRRIFLKVFYHIRAWRPSWSCDQYHLNKLLRPILRSLNMKYEFNWPRSNRGEDVWKCWRTTDGLRSHWFTISSPMSLRLRWAKNCLNRSLEIPTSCPNRTWEKVPVQTLYKYMYNHPDIPTVIYSGYRHLILVHRVKSNAKFTC